LRWRIDRFAQPILEIGGSRLCAKYFRTLFPVKLQVAGNDWISRTVLNGLSPEVRRKIGLSENKLDDLLVGGPQLEVEMIAVTGA
jgi:hypothetical protein